MRARTIAALDLAAALLPMTAPPGAQADTKKTEQLLARAALLGQPSQWSLVQSLGSRIEQDKFIAYAQRGYKRKEKKGAYLRLGPSFDADRRAGFYLGLEEDSVRFLFKVDLGVPEN